MRVAERLINDENLASLTSLIKANLNSTKLTLLGIQVLKSIVDRALVLKPTLLENTVPQQLLELLVQLLEGEYLLNVSYLVIKLTWKCGKLASARVCCAVCTFTEIQLRHVARLWMLQLARRLHADWKTRRTATTSTCCAL
jgi:hypothetical protein